MKLPFATILILPILPILLSCCVAFQSRPISADKTSADFNTRTLADPALHSFLAEQKAGTGTWSVNRLALAAAYFHPDVVLARAEADEVAATIKTAQMRPNPVFTFSPQYASFRAPAPTPWFFGPSLSIPIETAGKRSKRTEQALAAAEAARWRVSSRAWAARSRLRTAMLELHGARENIRLLETEQTLHDEAIKKLTAQMDAGDVSPFELTQARLMLNRTRLALQDAQRTAATGEARLAAAVGVPLHAIKAVTLDFSAFHRLADPGNSRRRALTQRADLMALLAEYAASESALKLELAKQYPDINVSPGYDYNSGQNRWQLGLNLALPLNRNRGPIAQAEAKRVTAEKKFLAQQATIQGELDIALAAYQASRAKATTAAQLAQEADAASDTTRKMVDAGNVSALELTRRQLEASAAKVALMAANIEAQTAAGALEDAMQATLKP
ncbi:MAG: TolC family protein [Prosthecobacter sp.]|uniref:TolC family protein n=1 Tax=Prosthecobacter sp. TaxID=1965333 RepID=UPI0039034B74